ncbi:FAD-dependent oxidoreductase [Rhodobacter capsulatus]|uniref:FAD-dependent oxidoreductase n=1 Tax=Rhodobacter capsulatus TaxID=1061 RepID=UPI0006DCD09B|nr:FAD-dependent oxidoreductase [Rhodobacter capsulatus]KQB15438.1 sulfide dehydrogenase [Rhodobacter capsulatus]KQB16617.1 sulfide dehydrogenase [Rhodobacter capsulatus]PZX22323.1 pyridine nucleotide-disulfide oxidoreductase [Rhodobacter capsulatus]QNR63029.1 FAD-dependent oxidoreductase [Rhodobacter capsulatus]
MTRLTRRHLALGLFATSAVAAAGGIGLALAPSERAVIVGAGPAGAQAALALRAAHPALRVALLERDPTRLARAAQDATAAAFGPPRTEATLAQLKAQGIEVMLDDVTDVDWTAGRLSLFSGRATAFDRLYLAPGTTARAEAIEGLDAAARYAMPAAWGNAREARRLAAQLAALRDAGHVVLRLPAGLSHPQVALHRALMLSRHLAATRPAARLTVLDATPTPALAQAFAMAKQLQGIAAQVAWITAAEGATVQAVDARTGRIETAAGRLTADVINFVPPHVAGAIARTAGLVDASGWCPCDAQGRSMLRSEAIVLGDARKGAARTLDGARLSVTAATVAQA